VTGNTFKDANDESIVVVGNNITITGNSFINTYNKAIALELGYGDIQSVVISGNVFTQIASGYSIGTFIVYRNNAATGTVGNLVITGNSFESPFSINPASYLTLRKCTLLTISGNSFDVAAVSDESIIRCFDTVTRGVISNNTFQSTSTTTIPFRNDSTESKFLLSNNLMNGRMLMNSTQEIGHLSYIQDTGANIYSREPISRVVWGNAAPTTGNWTRGDIVFHQFPSSANGIGWVCSASGNAGTWIKVTTPATGSGSPEGVLVAPIGTLYTNLSGGASTTLYVKTSGTGNTGWTAK
jgi:hypothetical protein